MSSPSFSPQFDSSSNQSASLSKLIEMVRLVDTQEGENQSRAVALAKGRVPVLKTEIITSISRVIVLLMESKDVNYEKKSEIASILSKVMTMVAAVEDANNVECVNLITEFNALQTRVNRDQLQLLVSTGVLTTANFQKLYVALVTAEVLLRRKNEMFVDATALSFALPISPDIQDVDETEMKQTFETFEPFFIGTNMQLKQAILYDLTILRRAGSKSETNRYTSLVALGKSAMTFAMHYESNAAQESLFALAERKNIYQSDSALEETAVSSGLHITLTEAKLDYINYADVVRAFVACIVKVSRFKHMDKMNQLFKWYGDDQVKHIVNFSE